MDEEQLKKYVGQYVVIYSGEQHNVFSGRFSKLENGCAVLSPFASGRWDVEKGLIRGMGEGEESVTVASITIIDPTTEENMLNYIKFQNKGKEEKKAGFGKVKDEQQDKSENPNQPAQ